MQIQERVPVKPVSIQKTVQNKTFLKHNITNKEGSLLMELSVFILQNSDQSSTVSVL